MSQKRPSINPLNGCFSKDLCLQSIGLLLKGTTAIISICGYIHFGAKRMRGTSVCSMTQASHP